MLEMNKEITIEALTAAAGYTPGRMLLVFANSHHHAVGGWKDFLGVALSVDSAKELVHNSGITYGDYQVVDYKSLSVVAEGSFGSLN